MIDLIEHDRGLMMSLLENIGKFEWGLVIDLFIIMAFHTLIICPLSVTTDAYHHMEICFV